MQIEKLLLKELELARERHRDVSTDLDKAVKMFGIIIIGLVTLIIKGDLPERAYLLVALVYLLFLMKITYTSYKKRYLAAICKISDLKLSNYIKEIYPTQTIFDLSQRGAYLRESNKYGLGRFSRTILYLFLLFLYIFFLHSGLYTLKPSITLYLIIFCTAFLILVFISVVSMIQNDMLKRRIENLSKSGEFEVPKEPSR